MRFQKILSTLLVSSFYLSNAYAQKIKAGLSMYLDYNLYHWYKKPYTLSTDGHSTGQVLNILPIGGLGLWVGYPGGFTLGVEGGIDYMPFAVDIKKYQGLGAISFPLMVRMTQPFKPQGGIAPFIGLGLGEQWNRTELYARPQGVRQNVNPYYKTYVGELSIGMGAGWRADEKQTGLLAFFARVGSSPQKAWTLNFGLRAKLLINPSGRKASPPIEKKPERTYQARQNSPSYF